MADHEAEIGLLRGYVEDAGLERLIKECAELVKRNRNVEVGEDVEIDADADVEM